MTTIGAVTATATSLRIVTAVVRGKMLSQTWYAGGAPTNTAESQRGSQSKTQYGMRGIE
jgi:hypothetical protein